MQALVEVDHQPDVVANSLAHGLDGRQIVVPALAAEAQLEAAEAAFIAELDGFRRNLGRFLQPKPVAVVGIDRGL